MFGIQYLKAPATTFVLQYKNGKVVRRGNGLSFYYFAPTSVLVQVPVTSVASCSGYHHRRPRASVLGQPPGKPVAWHTANGNSLHPL